MRYSAHKVVQLEHVLATKNKGASNKKKNDATEAFSKIAKCSTTCRAGQFGGEPLTVKTFLAQGCSRSEAHTAVGEGSSVGDERPMSYTLADNATSGTCQRAPVNRGDRSTEVGR